MKISSRLQNTDPVLQFPENSQSYNKYSYVMNNPLKYVDPSGYELLGGRMMLVEPDLISMNMRLATEQWEAWNAWHYQFGNMNGIGFLTLNDLAMMDWAAAASSSSTATPTGDGAPEADEVGDGGRVKLTKAMKEFFAVIVGESGNNPKEAAWMACCIINRLNKVGGTIEGNFWVMIGGTDDFKAYGGDQYNEIIAMTEAEIFDPNGKYANRIAGALSVLIPYLHGNYVDLTGGSAFWRGGISNLGSDYSLTGNFGNSYFFKLSNGNVWP